jgi:hypothetical protein
VKVVDYEPCLERAKVNVVSLSSNNYVIRDNSMIA